MTSSPTVMASSAPVVAFVLITVPAPGSGGIVERVKEPPLREFVKEVAAVYGEADVIVKVEVPSISDLHKVVMDRIQRLPGVKSTRTFVVIPQLHEAF